MFGDDAVLFLIVISLILGLGGVIFIQDKKNELHKSFFLLSIAIAIWVLANYMQDAVSKDSFRVFFVRLDFVFAMFMAYFFFNFCYVFSANYIKIKRENIYKKILFAILILFSLLLFFSNEIISNTVSTPGAISPVYGTLYFTYVAFFTLLDILGLIFLITKYKKENYPEKKQSMLIIVGCSLVVLVMIFSNTILPLFLTNNVDSSLYSRLGVYSVLVLIGFMSYAIAKSNFLNIRIIIAQLFAVGIVLVFFFGILSAQGVQSLFLKTILFFLVLYFARMIVANVKLEIKRKEEVEILNKELTERKEQLQKMADSLSITNEKLKVANEKLKVLDQAKSDFFSRASHDLRTPITGVMGYVSLLEEGSYGAVSDEQKTVFQKTLAVAKNMLALVEDFLTAAKLEAGGMQYNFAKAKVDEICQQIVETLYPKSKDRGLYLDFKKPEEELPELTIDASRIRESISNLVDNAIKYTEKGGVTVKIERAESSNYKPVITNDLDEKNTKEIIGPVIRITVSDTGMGIPTDGIQQLFSRFSRGKGTARLKTSGTGLGLYVCKGMIEGNGGKVWAESDGEGKGSRFIVELPIETPKEILSKVNNEQQGQKVV